MPGFNGVRSFLGRIAPKMNAFPQLLQLVPCAAMTRNSPLTKSLIICIMDIVSTVQQVSIERDLAKRGGRGGNGREFGDE